MSQSLTDIARKLSTPKAYTKTIPIETEEIEEVKPVPKVQLIYAFNGTGKTRLSREVKQIIAPKADGNEEGSEGAGFARQKFLYYSAFTEDLFYWDNDIVNDSEPKLVVQPNTFTDWLLNYLKTQGQDRNITSNFQNYTDEKLTPHFNENFSEVRFSFQRGNEEITEHIKISKGEESNFIWSVFYSLLELAIETLNVADKSNRGTDEFDQLEYVFIDDPVSSLDENHLIELASDLAKLIKSSESDLKFIITTHNPLFYNVLHNEFKKGKFQKYILKKLESGEHELISQSNDSPFSYHLYLKDELKKAIQTGQLHKYHFNFVRNILEKTSTFLGYQNWEELLPGYEAGKPNVYQKRLVDISSHSKHSGEEVAELREDDKRVLDFLVKEIDKMYQFER